MAKFYMMGNYTAQGFQGFLKDPKTDRSKAAQAAAIKLATEATGSLTNVTICEAININDVAGNAAKIAGSYKAPGQ